MQRMCLSRKCLIGQLRDPYAVVLVHFIIGYSSRNQSLVRFSPSAPDVETPLRVLTHPSNGQIAFSFSGGYYCVWDPTTRILTRYEDWW